MTRSTMFSRRQALAALGVASATACLPAGVSHAQTVGTRNFVFINLRGAADGLSMVMPVGDPQFARWRGAMGEAMLTGAHRLDAMFALHPALSGLARRYAAGQLLPVHAVASAYRDRSHFDAQNLLETGGLRPYAEQSGWMNRMIALASDAEASALAYGATIAPVLRGPNAVTSFAPSALPDADGDLLARVATLYAGDAQLHALYESALQTRAMAGDGAADRARNGTAVGTVVARLMTPGTSESAQEGRAAHIVSIDLDGWDTHNNQPGRMAGRLGELDALVEALATGLGSAWARTIILVATEFGRTVAVNGTNGTDHGTASAALLIGGAVRGGRVLADWPGLATAQLYEARDLRPTMAMESLVSGIVANHYGVDARLAARTLYPAHGGLVALSGLA